MDWESIEQVIKNPLFIVVAVVLVLLLVVLTVFAFRSVGKNEIKKLSLAIPGVKTGLANLSLTVNKIQEEAPKFQTAIANVADDFKKKVDELFARSELFEYEVLSVLELIPNEKVKSAVLGLKDRWKEKQRQIKEYIGISVSEIEEQLKERDLQIASLSDEINELKDLLKDALKNEENVEYGEREEGTND